MSTPHHPAVVAHSDSSPRAPRTNRRAFLRLGLAAAAFKIVPREVLGAPGRVSPNGKTTVADIGLGGQGMQNLAALLAFPEIQVVAVCDVDRERSGYVSWNWSEGKDTRVCGREPGRRMVDGHYGKQERSGQYRSCQAYSDFRELLEREDVDAVVISTPDHTHAVPDVLADRYGRPPKTLARSPGHYHEWVNACRGGPPAGANFVDHGGLLSEVCLLGNVAVRAQKRLTWDGPGFRFTNDARANQWLHREYRPGWTL